MTFEYWHKWNINHKMYNSLFRIFINDTNHGSEVKRKCYRLFVMYSIAYKSKLLLCQLIKQYLMINIELTIFS